MPIVLLPLLFFLALMTGSVLAEKISLSEAVDRALKNNPEIRSERNKWEATRSAAGRAYALPDPKVGADFEGIPAGSADLRQAQTRYYSISQSIPWPGMLLSEGSAASARADMQRFSLVAKERQIVKTVKSTYFELAKTDELIKIVSANIESARQGYKVAQANYSAGRASQVEALKMQVEYSARSISYADLKQLAVSTLSAGGAVPQGFFPFGEVTFKPLSDPITDSIGVTHFELEATQVTLRDIDEVKVFSIIRGHDPARAQTELMKSFALRDEPQITIRPAWWKRLPLIPFNILVELK